MNALLLLKIGAVVIVPTLSLSATDDEADFVEIHRFYEESSHNFFYVTSKEEFASHAKAPGWKYQGAIGFASAREANGTWRLNRYWEPAKARSHYYKQLPPDLAPKLSRGQLWHDEKTFVAWVWKRQVSDPGNQYVPVFASSHPEGGEVYYTNTRAENLKYCKEVLAQRGIRRVMHGELFWLRRDNGAKPQP